MNLVKQKKIFYELAELQLNHEPGEDSFKDIETIARKYKITTQEMYKIIGRGCKENWLTPKYPLEITLMDLIIKPE